LHYAVDGKSTEDVINYLEDTSNRKGPPDRTYGEVGKALSMSIAPIWRSQ